MSARADGGRAFPLPVTVSPMGDSVHGFDGMSLRDYFAGDAMASLISGSTCIEAHSAADLIAKTAYTMADAMIRTRGAV